MADALGPDDPFQLREDGGQAAPADPLAVEIVGAIHAAEGAAARHLQRRVVLAALRRADEIEVVAEQVARGQGRFVQIFEARRFGAADHASVFARQQAGHGADALAAREAAQEIRERPFAFAQEEIIEAFGERLLREDGHVLAPDDDGHVQFRLDPPGHFLDPVEERRRRRHADQIGPELAHAAQHGGVVQLFDFGIDELGFPARLAGQGGDEREIQRRKRGRLVGHARVDAERAAPRRK